jgi:hypothetical protein
VFYSLPQQEGGDEGQELPEEKFKFGPGNQD